MEETKNQRAKICSLIQARMGSTRLPGKHLLPIQGRPLISYFLERVQRAQHIDEHILATTEAKRDDPLVKLAAARGLTVYRGSEEDVLDRLYQAAKQANATVVVRLTADCPLIDPAVIDQVIEAYTEREGNIDYVTNTLQRTYPRGLDVEVCSFEALEKAWIQAKEPYEREHVTPYLYRHPEQFRLHNVAHPEDFSRYRLTVDTPDDFLLIRQIFEALYPKNPQFTMQDILYLLQQHPDWEKMNAHIQQKTF